MSTGTYCGPAPIAGNGNGPQGTCNGSEMVPPCAAGAVVGRYYGYTVPGDCGGRIRFDGRLWDSQLPPPYAVDAVFVWIRLESRTSLRFIGPGSVGFNLTPMPPPPVPPCRG